MFSGDTGRSRTDRKGIALFTELQSAALPFGYSISTEHQFLIVFLNFSINIISYFLEKVKFLIALELLGLTEGLEPSAY